MSVMDRRPTTRWHEQLGERPTTYRRPIPGEKLTEFHHFRTKDGQPLIDARGRYVGARVTRYVTTVTEEAQPEGSTIFSDYPRPVGTYFTARVHQVRANARQAPPDWRDFGASNGPRLFSDEADREAYIRGYLRAAERRARKAADL